MLAALLIVQGLTPIAVVQHPPVNEMSGIAKSRKYPGVYWVHNDSGDSARLFAIKLDGSVVCATDGDKYWVGKSERGKTEWPGVRIGGAKNVDWEDIATDGSNLYIADMGNNLNKRKDLGVYVVPEPNPTRDLDAKVAKYYPIRYPDQSEFPPKEWKFDCESIFVQNGKLYFLTKQRLLGNVFLPSDSSALYRLDTAYSDKPNVLTKVETRDDFGGWVTAADVSPDGKWLAVLTQAPSSCVWWFDLSKAPGDRFLSAPARRQTLSGLRQCEAICFEDDDTVIVTNEQRDIFRIKR